MEAARSAAHLAAQRDTAADRQRPHDRLPEWRPSTRQRTARRVRYKTTREVPRAAEKIASPISPKATIATYAVQRISTQMWRISHFASIVALTMLYSRSEKIRSSCFDHARFKGIYIRKPFVSGNIILCDSTKTSRARTVICLDDNALKVVLTCSQDSFLPIKMK